MEKQKESSQGRVKEGTKDVRRRPHQKRRAKPALVLVKEEEASAAISATTSSAPPPPPPQRDSSHLYMDPATWKCATTQSGKACLVCAYKIGCFDVALDTAFTTTVPNARPESCPRLVVQQRQPLPRSSRTSRDNDEVDDEEEVVSPCASWPTGAKSSAPPLRILTVGDGDFSYSVALARRLAADGGAATGLVATSYESRATLEKVYPRFAAAWQELKDAGATVRFGVDATALPAALQRQQPWQVVVWNFPCTAVAAGQDGQNGAMEANKALVRTFCARVRAQELHVTHKTKPPFDQWGLVDVVTNAASDDPWVYRGRIVLDRALWPPYVPRKALDRKSFPCHDACTYVFRRASVVAAESSNTAGGWLAAQLLPVTPDRLTELRAFWIQEQQTRRLLLQQRGKKRRYEKR